jgi:DNA-binding response OmpR family regulator
MTDRREEVMVTGEFEAAVVRGGSETILVVEDEEPVRRFTAQVLSRGGYRVLEAPTGAEALELAEPVDRIGLLLTDVVMPGMSGKELYQRLSASRPGLKVLFMSGYPDDTIASHGLLEPGLAFLQKPFRGPELLDRIGELLDRRLVGVGAPA